MKLPRKGILIRIVIYGSLLAFFGWQAVDRWLSNRDVERAAAERERVLDSQTKTITLPDGTKQEVLQVTPEQAEELFGVPASPNEAKAPEAVEEAK